jgi:hypothetical protein
MRNLCSSGCKASDKKATAKGKAAAAATSSAHHREDDGFGSER